MRGENRGENTWNSLFTRQARISWWDQEKLTTSKLAIIGVGGMGTIAALEATRLGIGTIHLFDMDVVEPSNLNRQILFSKSDVGHSKVSVATSRLRETHLVDDRTRVFPHDFDCLEHWQETCKILEEVDLVFNGLDLPEVKRVFFGAACLHYGLPMIYAGTDPFHGMSGMILFQSSTSGAPCYECLQAVADTVPPEMFPELLPTRVCEIPSIQIGKFYSGQRDFPPAATNTATATTTASVAMGLVVQYLHGFRNQLPNRIIVDVLNFTMESFHLPRRETCVLCGGPPDTFLKGNKHR